MGLIVEGRAAGDNCVLARGQSFDDLGWPRCCRDDRLRLVSEPQAQHRLIKGVRLAPGGEFVAPQFHVLLAPEPVGLFAENSALTAPFGHSSRRPAAIMRGRSSCRLQARMPCSPLTMMSRVSAMVSPIRLTIG